MTYIGSVTQDRTPDDALDSRPIARMTSAVGAVLGIALALLLGALPGVATGGARLPSALSASADQTILATVNRVGEARASFFKARGPNARRPDVAGGTPVLLAAAATLALLVIAAAAHRPARLLAQRPVRWPSTTRARAPPHA